MASGHLLSLAATIATIKILTSFLAPAQYGLLTLITAGIILPTWLFLGPISQSALRGFAPFREAGDVSRLIASTLAGYGLVWCGVLSVTVVGLLVGLDVWVGLSPWAVFLAAVLFGVDALNALAMGFGNVARRRREVALFTVGSSWMRALCLYVLMRIVSPTVEAALAGLCAAGVLGLCASWLVFFERTPLARVLAADIRLLGGLVRDGAAFAGISAATWLQAYADRYLIGMTLGTGAVGSYVAIAQIVSAIFAQAGNLLGQFTMPIAFELAGTGREPERLVRADAVVLRLVGAFLLCGLVAVGCLTLWGREIIEALTASAYVASGVSIGLLALAGLLAANGEVMRLAVLTRNRPALVLTAKLVAVCLGLPLLGWLATRHGLEGASAGAAVGGGLLLCTMSITVMALRRRARQFEPSSTRVSTDVFRKVGLTEEAEL